MWVEESCSVTFQMRRHNAQCDRGRYDIFIWIIMYILDACAMHISHTRYICQISELCYLFTSLHVRNPIIQISWLCRPPILVRWEDSATISPVSSEEGVEEPNWYLHYSKSCQNPSSILSCFWIFISLRKLDIYDMIFIDKTMDKDNKTYDLPGMWVVHMWLWKIQKSPAMQRAQRIQDRISSKNQEIFPS